MNTFSWAYDGPARVRVFTYPSLVLVARVHGESDQQAATRALRLLPCLKESHAPTP